MLSRSLTGRRILEKDWLEIQGKEKRTPPKNKTKEGKRERERGPHKEERVTTIWGGVNRKKITLKIPARIAKILR